MREKRNLTGMVFGLLTVLEKDDDYVDSKGRHMSMWKCRCACGSNPKSIRESSLVGGLTKSCGCLRRKKSAENGHKNKKFNDYELNLIDEHGLYGFGYCSNNNHKFYFDMDDYDKIKNFCWYENILKTGYSRMITHNPIDDSVILMHWIIYGKYCDHADRNALNNRKYNLRDATDSENAMNHNLQSNNTSGVAGVSFNKQSDKWVAYITLNKKRKYLGYFENIEDAIKTRLQAEKEMFGEFAAQKHLYEKYDIN